MRNFARFVVAFAAALALMIGAAVFAASLLITSFFGLALGVALMFGGTLFLLLSLLIR